MANIPMKKKQVLILNTGGTISSIKTKNGYEPVCGWLGDALAQVPSLQHPQMPEYTLKEYNPLLDSSNMTLTDWNRIATDIVHHYEHYDAFIILHGTDTMAYTASALSFILENLGKPVIVTGSQIPFSEVRNDALDNLITSLWLCAHHSFYEVCIYFNKQLLRGNRAKKMSAQEFNAFDSPNYPPLASFGTSINFDANLLLPLPTKDLHLQVLTPQFMANFRLFPGFSTEVFDYILQQPLHGLILETYGAGNAQNNDPYFLKILKNACDRGVVIVNCSQCPQGHVEMNHYATGYALKEAGLVSGHDMTLEAAHCKLLYLLSRGLQTEEVKALMQTNLCGELLA